MLHRFNDGSCSTAFLHSAAVLLLPKRVLGVRYRIVTLDVLVKPDYILDLMNTTTVHWWQEILA